MELYISASYSCTSTTFRVTKGRGGASVVTLECHDPRSLPSKADAAHGYANGGREGMSDGEGGA